MSNNDVSVSLRCYGSATNFRFVMDLWYSVFHSLLFPTDTISPRTMTSRRRRCCTAKAVSEVGEFSGIACNITSSLVVNILMQKNSIVTKFCLLALRVPLIVPHRAYNGAQLHNRSKSVEYRRYTRAAGYNDEQRPKSFSIAKTKSTSAR